MYHSQPTPMAALIDRQAQTPGLRGEEKFRTTRLTVASPPGSQHQACLVGKLYRYKTRPADGLGTTLTRLLKSSWARAILGRVLPARRRTRRDAVKRERVAPAAPASASRNTLGYGGQQTCAGELPAGGQAQALRLRRWRLRLATPSTNSSSPLGGGSARLALPGGAGLRKFII